MSNNKRKDLIEKGLSYCPKCDEVKELSEFNKDSHTAFGIAIYCRKCNKTKAKLRYLNHRDKHKNVQLKSDFNITLDEYNKILKGQNNGCAICGKTEKENGKMLAVDHDHKTDIVRGLLCSNCNLGLGKFGDDVNLLDNAIKYLKNERRIR